MKAAVVFTGSGPIVILTSYDSLASPKLAQKLGAKGLDKFIAHEVSERAVKKKYGKHYDIIIGDIHESDDLRVLDYNGHRVFHKFKLKELGKPVYREP